MPVIPGKQKRIDSKSCRGIYLSAKFDNKIITGVTGSNVVQKATKIVFPNSFCRTAYLITSQIVQFYVCTRAVLGI